MRLLARHLAVSISAAALLLLPISHTRAGSPEGDDDLELVEPEEGEGKPSAAQEPGAITIEEAVAEALGANPRIRGARAGIRRAEAQSTQASAKHYPFVDVTASVTKGFSGAYGKLGIQGLPGSPFKDLYGASVNMWWTVTDFGQTTARVRAAESGVDSAQARVETARWHVAYAVARRFYACVGAQDIAVVQALRVMEAEKRVALVDGLSDSGLRSVVDRELARADLARIRGIAALSEGDTTRCRARLAALLGRRSGSEQPVPRSGAELLKVPEQTIDELVDHARSHRADRRALLSDETSRRAHVDAERARHRPELRVTGSAGYAPADGRDDGLYAVGLGLEVPLFQGFQVRAAVEGSSAELEMARARLAELDLEIEAQVRGAYAGVTAALSNLEHATGAVAPAERALELAQSELDAGLVDALRLVAAERVLGVARKGAAEARARVGLAKAALEHAIGRVP